MDLQAREARTHGHALRLVHARRRGLQDGRGRRGHGCGDSRRRRRGNHLLLQKLLLLLLLLMLMLLL